MRWALLRRGNVALASVGWVVTIGTRMAIPVSTTTGINTTAQIHHPFSVLARHRRACWSG
jgi:hypothetical protein